MKTKVDFSAWSEVQNKARVFGPEGCLKVRCSIPSPLYVTGIDGLETLVGVDTDFEVMLSEPYDFFLDGPEGVRVFYQLPYEAGSPSSGSLFTNTERLPMESGSLYEVKRALRLQQFERRELMKEMRAAADSVRQMRATLRADLADPPVGSAAPAPAPEAKPEVKPEAKPEAASEVKK